MVGKMVGEALAGYEAAGVSAPRLAKNSSQHKSQTEGMIVSTGPTARIPAEAPKHADAPSGTRGI